MYRDKEKSELMIFRSIKVRLLEIGETFNKHYER